MAGDMSSPLTGQLVPPAWRKASYCVARECVEVAPGHSGVIMVRDSAQPRGVVLQWTAAEWRSLVAGIKGGAFDGRRP